MLMHPPGIVRRSPHPFPECISDFAFAGWIPVIGELQKLLGRGEYNPLCPAPLFESNFLQVTKRGELVDLHNRASLVTLGIAATSPALLLPDVMIIARPTERPQGEPLCSRGAHVRPGLELTRLIPLELVSLYLHDLGEQRLKLRLATGRVYYLQLCAPRGEERPLFARWLRLIYLLRAPSDSWASIPSWHTADLRGRSAKPPPSRRLWPIQEEEEPRALKPRLGEPPSSGSRTPSQGQPSGRQSPAIPTRGQQPSTQSVGGQGSGRPTSPSIAPVRRSPSTMQLLDGLSRSRAEVASPWKQQVPVSGEPSAERNRGQLSLAIPSGSQSPAGTLSQPGSSARSRATTAPGSPERSRASVGVGRSAVGTASVGMGRSAVGTASVGVGRSVVATASAAAGPSRPASTQPSGMGEEMEPGGRSREPSTERSRAQLGLASPSTEQGRSRSRSQRGSSAASGAAAAPSSPKRSRASVGVGRSAVGTASVGVGRSAVGTTSVGVERSAVGTASVGVGRSAVATASIAAGPSRPASTQPSGMGEEMEPGGRSREPSTERSRAQLGLASPSTEQGKSHSRSQRGSSAASRAAAAPSSPERSRASVGVGRSAVGTASVGVGRSLPSTASVAAGPSRLASAQPSGRSGERSRAQVGHASPSMEQAGSRSQSQRGSSTAPGPTGATMTPSSHERPSGSRAPSFPEPASSPMTAAAPPERSQLSGGVGPSEGATVALTVGPSGQRSRSRSRLGQAKRQGTRSRATVGESDKGKARSRASSTGHKKPSREQRLESKGKLKSALSSARHRSSLTFVTIYSALSNSLDKLTGGKLRQRRSQEDAKTQLSSKPSKRVTISGVVELSGQGSQETSSVAPSAMESRGEQGPAGSGAAPQRESGPLPKAQSGGSRAVTAPSSPERSRASVGVGRSAVATASVGVGRSAVATASVAAGPSRLGSAQPSGMGREMEPGGRSREPSVERSRAQVGLPSPSPEQGRSRSRSPTGTLSQPGSSAVSRDSGAAGPSERSRVSVVAGPSEMATVSVAVGPSELGPRSSARPSGRDQLSLPGRGSRERSKAGSQSGSRISSPSAIREAGTPCAVAALGMEGDDVSRETSKKSRASVAPGSAEKSRASVAPGSAEKSRASVAPGSAEKSRASVAPGSAEKSRASVAPGSAEKSRASVAPGSAEKSRASVAPGSAEKSRASVAPSSAERSRVSVAAGPSEKSRASVAAGPSQLATVSVAVGQSEPGSLSSARTPRTDAQRAPRAGKSRLSSPCSGAPLGTKAGDTSPGRASLGRSGEQSRSQAREEGGARSQSPSSQAPHARAAVSKGQGPSSTRPSQLDRQGELGWGSSRPSTTRSRSKGRQEDKRDPPVGHPASRGGSEQSADRMKSQ